MTDARIITREVLLEVVQAERHKAFEDGYELGQKVACLAKPEPDHKKLRHVSSWGDLALFNTKGD